MVPGKFGGEFSAYIKDGVDRLAFLRWYLGVNGVHTSVVEAGGTSNLVVDFPLSSYDPTFRIKTVVSHYDRFPGSPGANDNSAANFAIADFAIALAKNPRKNHNVRIVFTDCEERGIESVALTGSYQFAPELISGAWKSRDVFVFDGCGRGDVAVLGAPGKIPGSATLQAMVNKLRDVSLSLLQSSCEHWMELPIPKSDNAAFIARGVPAVCFCVLPSDEAELYAKSLSARSIVLPRTWRNFHSAADNIGNVDEGAFLITEKILAEIAGLKLMA